ncbi:hypothetical protein [Dendronalium sp. ChiSLP03b]
MQKAQKPFLSAPLPLCGLNDKSLTGHDISGGITHLHQAIGYRKVQNIGY